MIPKKIHYCWFGPAPLSKLVRKCMQTWREVMPDYEICLWNEENSPMNHPFVQQAYAAKKYAFVADYVRFWVLYNHGGVYMDTDMYVVKRFDDLLDDVCWFGYEDKQNQYINCAIMGVEKENGVLKQILDKYDRLIFTLDNIENLIVPRLITPILLTNNDMVTIYPYDYFYPFPFVEREKRTFMKYCTEKTYAIHLWDLSWITWRQRLFRDTIGCFVKKVKYYKNKQ